jgi:hypothetical protein
MLRSDSILTSYLDYLASNAPDMIGVSCLYDPRASFLGLPIRRQDEALSNFLANTIPSNKASRLPSVFGCLYSKPISRTLPRSARSPADKMPHDKVRRTVGYDACVLKNHSHCSDGSSAET